MSATGSGRLRPLAVGMGWPTRVPGGLNRYVADLHAALVRAGAQPVTVVFDAEAGVDGLEDAGAEAGPLPVRLVSVARRARAHARSGRTDVLVSHFALYGLLPSLVARGRPRRPFVVHFHGPWADEAASTRGQHPGLRLKRALERAVYRRAAAVVVLSQDFADLAVERYGVRRSRVHVVPPGVDLAHFHPLAEPERDAVRRDLGLAPDAHVVLTVRRLVARTGVDALVDAWAALPAGDRPAVLVVAGDGPERSALERRAASGGVQVRFAGRVGEDELRRWYQAADLTVVPSLHLEGFGLVVLESVACGTPVVASALGGMGEVLPRLDPSLVVPPGDVPALTARLAAAQDGALPGRDACRAFAEGFGWDVTAQRLLALYTAAAGPGASRRVGPEPAAVTEELS